MLIFISYRRRDWPFAHRLQEQLQVQLTGGEVYIDRKIAEADFEHELLAKVRACDVFVLVVTEFTFAPDRIQDEDDWIRREIATALELKKPIALVFYESQVLPAEELLPANIRDITRYQGIPVYAAYFEAAVSKLAEHCARISPEDTQLRPPKKLAAQSDATRSRRFEAAMPRQTRAGSATEVRVKITLPDSPGLRGELPARIASGEEIKKSDTRTSTFPMKFEADLKTGALLPTLLCAEVIADHFNVRVPNFADSPCGDSQAEIEVLPDHDSRTVIFTLTPKPKLNYYGRSLVTIRLYYQGRIIAENAVATMIGPRGEEVVYILQETPLAMAALPKGGVPRGAPGVLEQQGPIAGFQPQPAPTASVGAARQREYGSGTGSTSPAEADKKQAKEQEKAVVAAPSSRQQVSPAYSSRPLPPLPAEPARSKSRGGGGQRIAVAVAVAVGLLAAAVLLLSLKYNAAHNADLTATAAVTDLRAVGNMTAVFAAGMTATADAAVDSTEDVTAEPSNTRAAPSDTPTERSSDTPTPRPTERPSPTPTERPSDTPTEAPTETLTSTASPTPRPTDSPTPEPTDVPPTTAVAQLPFEAAQITAFWTQQVMVLFNDSRETVNISTLRLVSGDGTIGSNELRFIPRGALTTFEPGECIKIYDASGSGEPPIPLGYGCEDVPGVAAVSPTDAVWRGGFLEFTVYVGDDEIATCSTTERLSCSFDVPVAE